VGGKPIELMVEQIMAWHLEYSPQAPGPSFQYLLE